MPSTTPEFHLHLASFLQTAYERRVNDLFFTKLWEDRDSFKGSDLKMLTGQVGNCFKLAIMAEYTKNNQFEQAKVIHDSFGVNRVQLSLSAPMLTQLCRLIEWIVGPYLKQQGKSLLRHTDKHISAQPISFPEGYFKQSSQLDMATLAQIG